MMLLDRTRKKVSQQRHGTTRQANDTAV